jgi:hypothetical protein
MLDRYHAGWFSMAYWADVAGLAAQAAGLATLGAATGGAAAAAHFLQLLQERHSIFYNRCGHRQPQEYQVNTSPAVSLILQSCPYSA